MIVDPYPDAGDSRSFAVNRELTEAVQGVEHPQRLVGQRTAATSEIAQVRSSQTERWRDHVRRDVAWRQNTASGRAVHHLTAAGLVERALALPPRETEKFDPTMLAIGALVLFVFRADINLAHDPGSGRTFKLRHQGPLSAKLLPAPTPGFWVSS